MEFLILPFVMAVIVGIIASSKGRSGFGWAVYGFFLGFIALVHILVTSGANLKRCPDCLSKIPAEAHVCAHCRYKFA